MWLRGSQLVSIFGATLLCAALHAGCHGDGRGSTPVPSTPTTPPPPSASLLTLSALDSSASGAPPPPAIAAQPLRVLSVGPQGRTEGGGSVHVRFNQPVGTLELNDDQKNTPQIVSVPPLKGRTFFQSPELLVFEHEGDFKDATRYQLSLRGPVVAQSGARFEQPLSWEFETPRPKVSRIEPSTGSVDISRTMPIFLHFDQKTVATQVTAHLQLRAFVIGQPESSAKPVQFTVSESTEMELKKYDHSWDAADRGLIFTIKPQALWPAASEVIVAVTPGLVGTVGPLPLDTPFSSRFRTILPLKLVQAGCAAAKPCGLEPISLRFSNPVPEAQWKRITVTPKPLDLALDGLDSFSDLGSKEIQINGMLLPGKIYTVHIPADLTDGYAQKLGQAIHHPAVITRRPTMELYNRKGTLTATFKRTIGVVSRYVQSLRVRAVVLTDLELRDIAHGEIAKPAKAATPHSATTTAATDDDTNEDNDGETFDHFPWPTDPARPQLERTIPLSPDGLTSWSSIAIDLGELAAQARRAVLVEITSAQLIPAVSGPVPKRVRGLYRITDLGPVIMRSPSRSLLFLTRLSTREPVAGAKVAMLEPKKDATPQPLGTTDANGMLELPGLGDDYFASDKRRDMFVISEDATDDRAYLSASRSSSGYYGYRSHTPSTFRRKGGRARDHFETKELRPGERLIFRLVTERDAYLPGDRVRVVGWAAIDTPYARSGLVRPAAGTPVEFALRDSRNRTVATQATSLTKEGKCWAELPVPAADSLGSYTVTATLLGGTADTHVKVEDFRIPEFSVSATVSAADVIASADGKIDVTPSVRASASYYFGGQVKIRRAYYHHGCTAVNYRPPGLDYFWTVGDVKGESRHTTSAIDLDLSRVRSDADNGRLFFTPTREQQIFGDPNRCVVDVQAGDASFQSYGARTEYMIHPARYYLAVHTPHSSEEGEPLSIPVRAVGHDGQRVAGRSVGLILERHWRESVFKMDNGKRVFDREEAKKEVVRRTTLEVPGTGADAQFKFTPTQTGNYVLQLVGGPVDQAQNARTRATFQIYPRIKHSTPAVAVRPPPRGLELLVNTPNVKPSDVLDVTVRAPWPKTSGVIMMSRNGLREQRPLRVQPDVDAKLQLPIDDSWFPMVTLQALVVRPTYGNLSTVDTTSQQINMAQDHRRLKVKVEAPLLGNAGAKVPITVQVTDAGDKPLAAETTRVALWAVDEAVLDLTGYHVPDLLASFVPERESHVSTQHEFSSLILPYSVESTDPWLSRRLYGSGRGFGAGGAGLSGRYGSAPSVVSQQPSRQKFEITPVFLADVAVGPNGSAKIDAKLPDNLTTFRITAIASARLVDGESPGRFGMNDTRLRVTAPLIVRPALPRSLRPGDQAEAATLVNNLGGPEGDLTVTVRVFNDPKAGGEAMQLIGKSETRQHITAGAIVRIPFQLVAERPGRPEVEMSAVLISKDGKSLRDAVRVPVPIEAERTLVERVATYGTLSTDQPVAIPLRLPRDADPRQGGLKLEASTSLLGDLSSAARSLVSYPYGCVEQTASRMLPLLAISELRKSGFMREEIGDADAFLASGVQRILSMQTSTGGFAYWPGGREPNDYATAYALWILTLADRVGAGVPREALNRAADYLQGLFKGQPESLAFQDPLKDVHAAIAAYTLSELERPIPELIEKLYTGRSELPIFGRAFLLLALHRAMPGDARTAMLAEELFGNIAELPATAHVVERVSYNLDSVFYSEARSDAIVLLSLLRVRPEHPVLVKLVRGLLSRRSGTAWRNTQENAYSLMALAEYARHNEKEPPKFTGSAWVGQTLLAQVQLAERTSTPHTALVPMARLLAPLSAAKADDALPLILQRTGSGRMYYRVGLEWTPRDANPPPRAQGLRITRTLRDRNKQLGPNDVLPAGEPLAFDLELENRVPIHYLAIDIPLPAGLESIQTRLNGNLRTIPFPGSRGNFVSHEESWKDRTVIFADRLQPGKHHHTLYLRATTPGRYTLPPAHGEAMYTPEVYGRTTGGIVEIR